MRIPKGGIAFFDSGIGGLTVLADCKKVMEGELFYYYGDNGNAPYGNLPPKKIKRYVQKAFRLFARLRVRAVVLACNTATALCVEELRKKYPFPIVGAEPAVLQAAKNGGEVLVLATKATCQSARLQTLLRKAHVRYPHAKVTLAPCEGLAGEIEERGAKGDFTEHLPNATPKSVVLGCTHYIYIKEQIQSFYRCNVVDGNGGIAKRLRALMQSSNHLQPPFALKPPLRAKKSTAFLDGVYFLGGYKTQNLRIYEQMFGLKVGK